MEQSTPVRSPPAFNANTVPNPPATPVTATYTLTVQAGDPSAPIPVPPIPYDVAPQVQSPLGDTYFFAPKLSASVIFPPATPDVLLDFSECVGLIEVRFCDPAGNPVIPSYHRLDAAIANVAQAYGTTVFGSSKFLPVRGGNTFNLTVIVGITYGTDSFLNQITLVYGTNYTVTVGCDEIVTVKFIVPPSPISGDGGGGGSTLGKIIGNVDMLGEIEHFAPGGNLFTIMGAVQGPLGNFRYDLVEPLGIGGPSSGPFSLKNLLPSDFLGLNTDYQVSGALTYGLGRRFQLLETPKLDGSIHNPKVTVPSGTIVDLGDTFVMNAGWVVGDIVLCGPDEGISADSPLRRIFRATDPAYDVNLDGIPDNLFYTTFSRVIAYGHDRLGTGAAKTASGGLAQAEFAGDFVTVGPDKNHFVGDYRLTLGGLNQETTRWNLQGLPLRFYHAATPANRDSYIDSYTVVVDPQFQDVEIVPTKTVTINRRYGFSQVTVNFHTTSGTLFSPFVYGNGSFNGLNFEGQSAQYSADVAWGYGTPISLATATPDGQVVLCIPEGTYTFYPTVESVNPGSNNSSHNTLPPISVTVGPCEIIVVDPNLVLNVNTIPECVAQPELALSGSVSSAANVASITYTLNGTTVSVCNNCGLNPTFNFTIILADCDNALQITATDVNGLVSSRSKTIHFDGTPPVLSGCQNRTINIQPGELGTVVIFAVAALDNCDGVVQPVCNPPSGSFFPEGATIVTCSATDECGNVGTCTFTVTVTVTSGDRTPPTIQCSGDIITATDPGQCSAVVTFTSTASDDRPGVSFACSPPSGSTFSKGTTTVICTATDAAGNTADCSFSVTVNDTEKPTAECVPTTNPDGKEIPTAGTNPRSGQNPDGFYQLLATDNCDAATGLQIFVKDSAEGPCGGAFVAGPYQSGDKVKLTQSPGQTSVKPMAGVIVAHINTKGDPVLVVVDSSGNAAVCTQCLVPQPPK